MDIPKRSRFQVERGHNGLLFGVVAGFWLALGIWGLDAILLWQAHAAAPWLKLLIGAPLLMMVGAAVGWLTVRVDNAALGAFLWLLAGIASIWIASHVPFEGLSWVTGLLDPKFAGLEVYPFVESARVRMILLYVVAGILLAIGGAFELFFVESATNASSQVDRLVRTLLCFVIFIPVGLLVDNLINRNLRQPIVGMDRLIQVGIEARQGTVSKEQQREMGVRALLPFDEQIGLPYRLILGNYDPQTMEQTSVHLDFSGVWGACNLIGERPFVCWLSSERYLQKVGCLVEGGDTKSCKLKLAQGAAEPQAGTFSSLDVQPLEYGILGQRGNVVLAIAEDAQGDQVECILREVGDVLLERCFSVSGVSANPLPLPPTPTPKTPAASATPQAGGVQELLAQALDPTEALVDPGVPGAQALEDATVYRISLEIAPDLRSFDGLARVDVTNRQDTALDELFFRLLPNGKGSYGDGSLTVLRVSADGGALEGRLSVEDTAFEVRLPDPLQPGESVALEFDFRGEVPQDFGGSATPSGYGIYNLSDGLLALSGWYPVLAVYDEQGWNLDPTSEIGDSLYSEVGLYSVDLSLPEGVMVAATGVKTAEHAQDGRVRAHFESGPVRDFFIFAGAELQRSSRQVGGTLLNSYYTPAYEPGGSRALEVAAESLGIFNEKFGLFPYKELDVVSAPMRNALGVEFPGIVMIGLDLYADPQAPEFEITVAHEVAHQWWYGVVGNDVFESPWLDEALTTYSSSLYYQYSLGEEYADGLYDSWQNRYDRLLAEGDDDLVTASLEYFESLNRPAIYGAVAYTKGALFFKALRAEIGDQAFFQGLQEYYRLNSFQVATPEDLLAAFEKTSGRQLDAFYQEWLYSKK